MAEGGEGVAVGGEGGGSAVDAEDEAVVQAGCGGVLAEGEVGAGGEGVEGAGGAVGPEDGLVRAAELEGLPRPEGVNDS